MDFDKHKEAVLLSKVKSQQEFQVLREKEGVCNWVTVCDDIPYINSQMPTQNYKNNDTNKYLEPQTRTSLKKIYIMFMMKNKLRKTYES